jgi:hypothetical protein
MVYFSINIYSSNINPTNQAANSGQIRPLVAEQKSFLLHYEIHALEFEIRAPQSDTPQMKRYFKKIIIHLIICIDYLIFFTKNITFVYKIEFPLHSKNVLNSNSPFQYI